MKKYLFAILCLWCGTMLSLHAQDKKNMFNPVTTSVTSQSIAPDARGGAMGDLGAATEPDVSSQYWNPAKCSLFPYVERNVLGGCGFAFYLFRHYLRLFG